MAEAGLIPVPSASEIQPMLETMLLSPTVQRSDVEKCCKEAIRYGFAAVCVSLSWVETAAAFLKGADVLTVAAIDFPFGADPFPFKVSAASWAAEHGAQELNVAVSHTAILSGDKAAIREEFQAIRRATPDIPVKAVLETSRLSDAEVIMAVRCAEISRFEFVAGGTGFFGSTSLLSVFMFYLAAPSSMKIAAAGECKLLKQILPIAAMGVKRFFSANPVALLGLPPLADETES